MSVPQVSLYSINLLLICSPGGASIFPAHSELAVDVHTHRPRCGNSEGLSPRGTVPSKILGGGTEMQMSPTKFQKYLTKYNFVVFPTVRTGSCGWLCIVL